MCVRVVCFDEMLQQSSLLFSNNPRLIFVFASSVEDPGNGITFRAETDACLGLLKGRRGPFFCGQHSPRTWPMAKL